MGLSIQRESVSGEDRRPFFSSRLEVLHLVEYLDHGLLVVAEEHHGPVHVEHRVVDPGDRLRLMTTAAALAVIVGLGSSFHQEGRQGLDLGGRHRPFE